jgi:hypothetical protein
MKRNKKIKPLSRILKGWNVWLPRLVSEIVLSWDKIRINMHRLKHGKIIISY